MNSYQESAEKIETDLPSAKDRPASPGCEDSVVRAIVEIEGNVQGVGLRPFLYRLATEFGLRGSAANGVAGVDLEIEGPYRAVQNYLNDIPKRQPPLSRITAIRHRYVDPVGHPAFVIAESGIGEHRTAQISPDVAVCEDCLREMFDASDRRYRYPFINCTNCGPRYTIIRDVPYDRAMTTMASFTMCGHCQAEYDDPTNRRFHAQPNACWKCGPRVWLAESDRQITEVKCMSESARSGIDAIDAAVRLLEQGAIVAVKGIGGFHLACDATNERAIETMRQRKNRIGKPFALMVPDLTTARQLCQVDANVEKIIGSPQRPIVLLPKRTDAMLADSVAPCNDRLGVMLPYSPLHYRLFFDEFRKPRFRALVMTSGNIADEPIATDNRQAFQRLGSLADGFLFHDRDIVVPADDSVVCYDERGNAKLPRQKRNCSGPGRMDNPYEGTTTMIRRSRGYVPDPVFLNRDVGEVLAVGGQLKNTVAVSRGKSVFLSHHVGDLDSLEALQSLQQSVEHLQQILGTCCSVVAHDLHPDYLSTRFARQLKDVQLVPVQHHHAHVAACMAEYDLAGPVVGVALDGSGYGTDGTIWGGEILFADYGNYRRVAHFRQVPLPGNEMAIKQPWRMALGYLDDTYGDDLWKLDIPFLRNLARDEAELVLRAARRSINSPKTSSCGRLFDAVASLIGIRQHVSYEGQAAMELELAIGGGQIRGEPSSESYTLELTEKDEGALGERQDFFSGSQAIDEFTLDSRPLIAAIVADVQAGLSNASISYRFHQSLAQSLTAAITRVVDQTRLDKVVLGGGCFQNRVLLRLLTELLERQGLVVFSPRLLPANDGALALGQIMVAAETSTASTSIT